VQPKTKKKPPTASILREQGRLEFFLQRNNRLNELNTWSIGADSAGLKHGDKYVYLQRKMKKRFKLTGCELVTAYLKITIDRFMHIIRLK
jgi:hypothetical protein